MKISRCINVSFLVSFIAVCVLPAGSFGAGIMSASISGRVTTEDGTALEDVVVTVVHQPTNQGYEIVSKQSGRFNLSGLRVGGPYLIRARRDGFVPAVETDVYLELSRAYQVRLEMKEAAMVELEEFTVTAGPVTVFDRGTGAGGGYVVDELALREVPEFRRHLNDFARLNPFVTMIEDERNQISAVGQNNRFNSIQVDGLRINDQFGLSSDGTQAFRNPISIDTIEQITVEVTPFDVRQSGFTGASINAVTKSGTNEFHGSIYHEFSHKGLRGEDDRGVNTDFREETTGITFGGPILRDRLFFFLNWEEFLREDEPGRPGFIPDSGALAQLQEAIADYGFDAGTFPDSGIAETSEKKYSVKMDWQVNPNHRLTFKYTTNDGVRPSFGNFDDFAETALDSNFFRVEKSEDTRTVQWFGKWGEKLNTEFSIAQNEFRQPTTFDNPLPQVEIDSFPAADGGDGELFFGTEQFRHQNIINVDTLNIKFSGDYDAGNHVITFGGDLEKSEFFNLFLQSAYGNFLFDTLEDFINDNPRSSYRNTGVEGFEPAAISDFTQKGVFVQDHIQWGEKLSIQLGLRYDWVTTDSAPPPAVRPDGTTIEEVFGRPNNGTVDGSNLLSPRVGFKYEIRDEQRTQIRGGAGLFLGRAPWVWLSNAYTNNGMTTNQLQDLGSFREYIQGFQSNVLFLDPAEGRPDVDLVDRDIQLNSVWKLNLALDHKIEFLKQTWVMTAEMVQTWVNQGFAVQRLDITPTGQAPDGRPIYADLRSPSYDDAYFLHNTELGESTYVSFGFEKPYSDHWYFNFAYTHGSAREVFVLTSSRAVSNWRSTHRFDQSDYDELGTSAYTIKHRFLIGGGYDFSLFKNFKTRLTFFYEGRSGRPYSAIFGNDINGDGRNDNDLFYVPTGPGDSRVNAEESSGFNELMAYIDSSDLADFKGRHVPRNAFLNVWVHRVDVTVKQEIPVWGDARAEVFFKLINLNNLLDTTSGRVNEISYPFNQRIARASIVDNQYVFDYSGAQTPADRYDGSYRSRWLGKVGVKFIF